MRRTTQVLLLLLLVGVVGHAAAFSRSQLKKLTQMQEAYAAAIRWSDFDTANGMIAPTYREQHPQTDLDRGRYAQVQISGYRALREGEGDDGTVVREVEVRVINRNTQAERTVRCEEAWRWDEQAKRWWLISGLPDLWTEE